MFGWQRKRRRKKLLAQAWPASWSGHLHRNVRLSWGLNPIETAKLQQLIKVFIAEKNWEGIQGLTITEEIQVTVAAQASLMLLGIEDFYFDNVKSVLIFPRVFDRTDKNTGEVDYRAGEAWQGGPIVLSWRDVVSGGRNNDGRNVVVHEFAHALDGLDGEMGGSVNFDDSATDRRWREVVSREYEELRIAERFDQPTFLDHYGATNRAEFFAVASEAYFEQPIQLRAEKPELFELLRTYYRVESANWQSQLD